MKDLIKVRIDKANEDVWYSNQIGNTFNVIVWSNDCNSTTFQLKGTNAIIKKSDCIVLQDNTEAQAPEPKGWCIKRTPENAEVLNKWALIHNGIGSYTGNDIYMAYICEIDKASLTFLTEDFTELHTVEEFFAKVNYTPEGNQLKPVTEPAPVEQKEESEPCTTFYSRYYPLFKHINDEHGLLLLESEMQEIITIVNEIQK